MPRGIELAEPTIPESPEFVLTLDNLRPISAASFSKMLNALGSDYKRIYGRDLIVVSVTQGSLTTRLRDASKLASQANDVVEFGKNIAKLVAWGIGVGVGAHMTPFESDAPLKSVEAVANVAAQTGSKVEFRYSKGGKEEIILNITPAQAETVRRKTIQAKRLQRMESENQRALSGASAPRRLTYRQGTADATEHALRSQFVALSYADGGFHSLQPDVRALIVALVQALSESSGGHRTDSLAMELDAEGNHAAANFIRDIAGGRSGNPTELQDN